MVINFIASPHRNCVTSPFMVRQAHHARTAAHLKINGLAIHPERVKGRMAHCDTVSLAGR
jgi:hypothetical protein